MLERQLQWLANCVSLKCIDDACSINLVWQMIMTACTQATDFHTLM